MRLFGIFQFSCSVALGQGIMFETSKQSKRDISPM